MNSFKTNTENQVLQKIGVDENMACSFSGPLILKMAFAGWY